MKKILFLLSLILLLILTPVFSQPPGQVAGDLKIFYPKIEYVSIEKNYTFHLHTISSLNELLNVNDYTCIFHLYGINGKHEIEQEMSNDANGIDKELLINPTLYNDVGEHSYNIYCNDSAGDTGFVSEPIYFSKSGRNPTNLNRGLLFLSIIILFLGISAISLWLSTLFKNEELSALRLTFFWMAIINMLVLTAFLAVYSNCDGAGCVEIENYDNWFLTYFSTYSLFTIYVLWNYTFNKLKKTNENWIVKK